MPLPERSRAFGDLVSTQNTEPFRHLILTRFNCRFADRDFPARTQPGWLDGRFDLFEEYCLPTMKAQTSQDFDWLVFFDAATPQASLDRAHRIFAGFDNFHVRFLDVFTGEHLKTDVTDFLGDRQTWLLSTRLDNDDGLGAGFVESLQDQVSVGRREALNFPVGVVLSGDRTYVSRQSSNAFLSVSEPYAGFKTALGIQHKDMARHMPVRDVDAGPMWLQVIHDSNVSNKRRGRRVLRRDMPRGFESVSAFSRKPPAESAAMIMLENLTLSFAWAGRDAAAHVYRQVRHFSR